MATKVLLIEDVDALGRSGDLVNVKPGFARNYLLPQGFGVVANAMTLRKQQRLKEERAKKALVDKKDAEELASRFNGLALTKVVKVDHEGHMYGSVTAHDIHHLLQDELKVELDKKSVQLKHPIKQVGVNNITIKLKEGVTTQFTLNVIADEAPKVTEAAPTPAPARRPRKKEA